MSIMGPLTKREHDAYQRGDRNGYSLGFTCGQINEWCFRRDRVRSGAFAAIRRAAEVARRIERDTTWHDVDDGLCDLITAAGIRDAIRAAIGSPKA